MSERFQMQKSSTKYTEPFSKGLRCDLNLKISNPKFKNVLVEETLKVSLPGVERLKQDPFPNDYLLAFFSSAVYNCNDSETMHLPDNWRLLTTAQNEEALNKYVGAVFFNPISQQIVVAHRGTRLSEFGSIWSDIVGIWAHSRVDQMSSAATLVDLVRSVAKSVDDTYKTRYHISLTGHSLGGWLAQITTFTIKYLQMEKKYFYKCIDKAINHHAHTVVFDSPGCEEMLVKLKRSYDLRYYNLLTLDQLDITVFLSSPNRINTCNHHIGTLYRLESDCSSMTYSEKHTFIYSIVTHNMSKMLSLFDNTGKVIHGEVYEIVDWPVSGVLFNKEYEVFFKYGNSSNNYNLVGNEKLIENETGKFFTGIRYQATNLRRNESCIRKFTQEELWLLECWNSLRRNGVVLSKINEFFHSIEFVDGVLPDFEIDLKNHKILCVTETDLEKTIRNCKQLTRWFPEGITNALKVQLSDTPASFDTVLYMNSENYLKSLKHSQLQFVDNLLIREFLKSDKSVLNLITNQCCSDIELTRIYNIITQTVSSSSFKELNQYVQEKKFVFINWKYLSTLHNVFDINYIFKDDCELNLIIINFCHDLKLRSERETMFLGSILKSIRDFHSKTSKKFIFLTNDCYDKEIVEETFASYIIEGLNKEMLLVQKTSDLTISDVETDSQMFILNNIVMKLQNDELSLKNILNLQDIEALELSCKKQLNSLVDSKVINAFTLGNTRVEIGYRVPSLCDSEVSQLKFYKELTLEHLKKLMLTNIKDSTVLFYITYTRENESLVDQFNEWNCSEKLKIAMIQTNDEAYENFTQLCSEYRNKQVYWFEVNQKAVILKQLYNSQFYIHRKFIYTKFKLKTQKLDELENPDLFIFSDVNQRDSMDFIQKLKAVTSLVTENILLESSAERASRKFERESLGTRPVHWFIVEDVNTFRCVWYKSNVSVDNLRKNLTEFQNETLDEKEINRKTHDTWIIADGPGAGKSTTLTNMFDGLRKSWILRINLKDIDYRSEFDKSVSIDDVVTFLLEKSKSAKCDHVTKSLLAYLLQNKSVISVCVLFDGFDEIRGTDERQTAKLQNYVIELLKFCKYKTQANIWVTTRDNRKEMLENSLSVFAIKFGAIGSEELERFLKEMWKCRLSCELNKYDIKFAEIENKMDNYIKELFLKAKENFGEEISLFIGIPLQMRMLGELAVPNIELFNQTADFRVDIPNSVLEFFRTFIQYKYRIYFKKTKLSLILNGVMTNWLQEDLLMKKHQELALEKIFPDGNECVKFNDDTLVELNSVGLIRLSNSYSDFEFIDRNIAYYFISVMIVDLLRSKDIKYFNEKYPALENVLLSEVFLNSEYRVVRLFINDYFSEIYQFIDVMRGNNMQFYGRRIVELLSKNEFMGQLCNNVSRTALHILVDEQYSCILQFLIDSIRENTDLKENTISPLVKRDKRHETALRIALRKKYFSFIEQFISLIDKCSYNFQEQILLSTIFVRYGDQNSEDIEYLANYLKNNLQLTIILNNIRTKYDLILKLHKASRSGSMNEVEVIFEDLPDNYKFYLLHTVDKDGSTPPLLAIKHKHKELAKYFIEMGIDLETEDHHGMTLVARAAQNRDLDTLQLLVLKGYDYKKPDRRRLNPMLHAAKRSYLEVVQYFIEILNVDVNYKDLFGHTAVWWAAKSGHGEVVAYLIEKKCDIESEDRHGIRPLLVAIRSQNWNIVRQIVEAGANVNILDGFGKSPLDRVRQVPKPDMERYLIEKGAYMTSSYLGDQTP